MHSQDGYITAGDGVRLFYRVVGRGPHMVVVPNGTYLFDDLVSLADERIVVFFDLRNRGRSDATEPSQAGGILQDVEDVRVVAQHFGYDAVDVVGHSFAGLLAVLYAMTYAGAVRRIIQIGPMSADPDQRYPPSLTNMDATFRRVMTTLASLQQERTDHAPDVFCEKVWTVLRTLYVTDPADADRIRWGRCSLPNERNAMKYFFEQTLPSIRRLNLTAARFREITAPVLVVHGTKDRSAPYGAGREWALMLPNARLISVEGAGHAPWIEASEEVLGGMKMFLGGQWPATAERVSALMPGERVNGVG